MATLQEGKNDFHIFMKTLPQADYVLKFDDFIKVYIEYSSFLYFPRQSLKKFTFVKWSDSIFFLLGLYPIVKINLAKTIYRVFNVENIV